MMTIPRLDSEGTYSIKEEGARDIFEAIRSTGISSGSMISNYISELAYRKKIRQTLRWTSVEMLYDLETVTGKVPFSSNEMERLMEMLDSPDPEAVSTGHAIIVAELNKANQQGLGKLVLHEGQVVGIH